MKTRRFLILMVSMSIALCIALFFFIQITPEDFQIKKLTFEVGREVSKKDISASPFLLAQEEKIDTTKVGKKEITLAYKSKKKTKSVRVEIEIVDTESPKIIAPEILFFSMEEQKPIEEEIKIEDNSKEKILPVIKGEYDKTKEGTYQVEIEAKDTSGNVTTKTLKLVVLPKIYQPIEKPISKDTEVIRRNENNILEKIEGSYYINGYLLVNKSYKLKEGFVPQNTYKNAQKVTKECNSCIDTFAYQAFQDMKNDAKKKTSHYIFPVGIVRKIFKNFCMQNI